MSDWPVSRLLVLMMVDVDNEKKRSGKCDRTRVMNSLIRYHFKFIWKLVQNPRTSSDETKQSVEDETAKSANKIHYTLMGV
jgi:hypothetical protein